MPVAAGHVRTTDSAETEGELTFMITELVEGSTLVDLQDGPPPLPRVLELANSKADGLGASHVRRVTQRELNLAKVMVNREERANIVVFGRAKVRCGGSDVVSLGASAYEVATRRQVSTNQ